MQVSHLLCLHVEVPVRDKFATNIFLLDCEKSSHYNFFVVVYIAATKYFNDKILRSMVC